MNGMLNLLKPPGMSSAAAVGIVKRLTGERVGHAGTLDPEAAGVLPILVGRATRMLDYLPETEKEYIAQIGFGVSTDTQDAQGKPLAFSRCIVTRAQLEGVLPAFIGKILQCPPAYSAIKQGGRPLYELARKGQMVQTAPRPTVIHSIEILSDPEPNVFVLRVRCGRGTYIRTLCHDIGTALDCPAHMRFLLRTRSGYFKIDDAVTLEEIAEAANLGTLPALLMPCDAPLAHYMRVDVPNHLEKQVLNGVAIQAHWSDTPCRVYVNGQFTGMYAPEGDKMRPAALILTANDLKLP